MFPPSDVHQRVEIKTLGHTINVQRGKFKGQQKSAGVALEPWNQVIERRRRQAPDLRSGQYGRPFGAGLRR